MKLYKLLNPLVVRMIDIKNDIFFEISDLIIVLSGSHKTDCYGSFTVYLWIGKIIYKNKIYNIEMSTLEFKQYLELLEHVKKI